MSILGRIANFFGGQAAAPRPATPPVVSARPAPTPAPAPPPPPPRDTPASRRVLNLQGQDIATLEGPIAADISLNLAGCSNLRALPDGIRTGSLTLSGCSALAALPAGIDVAFLDLSGCTGLRELPRDLRLRGGRLTLAGCTGLTELPAGLGEVAVLDLSGCSGISSLPADLVVTSWIDVAGTGLTGLPELLEPVGVRWNGVAVSRKVAFAPHTLTRAEIDAERDPQVRAVMESRTA